jgi:hypothetical protein
LATRGKTTRGICGEISLKRTMPSFKKALNESTACLSARIKAGEDQREHVG